MSAASVAKAVGRRVSLWIVIPIVLPLAILIWSGAQPPPSTLQLVAPFGRIKSMTVRALPFFGPENRLRWVVEYDVEGVRYRECPGGLTARQTVFHADGIQAFPTHIESSAVPRLGTGVATFQTIEVPLSLAMSAGRTYQLEIEVTCLDENGAPIGLSARSPLVSFEAVAPPLPPWSGPMP